MFEKILAILIYMHSFSAIAERHVPVVDGAIELEGFIAGGGYSQQQREAIRSAAQSCSDLYIRALEHFDRFRVVYSGSNTSRDVCGDPKNEPPFGTGYQYVYRPKILVRVDPEDDVVEIDGSEISGIEAPPHGLWEAFTSFNASCFSEVTKLKSKLGSAMIAATCGVAKSNIRMIYSSDHRMDLPHLKITSKMKIILRKNVPAPAQSLRQLPLVPKFNVETVDLAQAMTQAQFGQPAILAVNFAGSISKIDLKSKRVLWERNLTNPEPNSVRMTTSLNTVATSSDGKYIVTGGDYGYLALLDGQSGQKIRLLSCDPKMFSAIHFVGVHIDQSNKTVYSVARLSDYPGSSTGYNRMNFPSDHEVNKSHNRITRWNLETGKELWSLDYDSGDVLSVGVTRDELFGYVIATDRVMVLKPGTGEVFREFPLSHYEGALAGSIISGAAFSDDMRLLALSAFSGIILIDTQSGKMLRRFRASFRTELGNPEISVPNGRIRGFNAYGQLYEWDLFSGQLLGEGFHKGLSLNYNGPHNMPLLSILNGEYLIQSGFQTSGGMGISFPRAQEIFPVERLCKAGPDSELPPLTIRKGGRLAVWGTGN